MSKHEAVEAYLQGRIDRREFVRRLTLAGVSAAAAVAVAQSLAGEAAAAGGARSAGYAARFQDYGEVQDSDADGLSDEEEADLGTDPEDPDTDGDGVEDGAEVDAGTDPLDKTDYPTAGGTPTLPNTGVADGTQGSSWLAPLAVAGAGAAFLARKLRRTADSTN
jgi:hypothetical protein